jgi:RNA polymerase sigma-70 factor, ECF subfamily
MLEDTDIISNIRAGTTNAFVAVVDLYQAPILRYLYRLTGNTEVAQDLAQDTFIQAYKSILKTKSELQLKAWLYRIATNNARQFHRRKRLLKFVSFEWQELKAHTHNQPEGEIEKTDIQEALRGVPIEQRMCLVLHFVEGFKYREIAETLNISEDAVRMRVTRGKQIFQSLYAEEGKSWTVKT